MSRRSDAHFGLALVVGCASAAGLFGGFLGMVAPLPLKIIVGSILGLALVCSVAIGTYINSQEAT